MPQSYPVFQLEAVPRNVLIEHSIVVNKQEMEYFLYVHIPVTFAREFALVEIRDMDTDKCIEVREEFGFVQQDCMKPWIQIIAGALNQSVGYHKYRVSFVNRQNGDTSSLYFGYTLQDNNPDRPYDYMKEQCRCDECCC